MSIDLNKLIKATPKDEKVNTEEIDAILESNQILLSIAKSIMRYRKEHNLTQKQLADQLHVKQEMISKIEKGDYNPTFKQIHKISRKLTNSADLFLEILQDITDNVNLMYIDFECSNVIKFENKIVKNNKDIQYKEGRNIQYQWEKVMEE